MVFSSIVLALAMIQGGVSDLTGIPAGLLPTKPDAAKVIAKVNGEEIKVSDIDSLLWEWRSADVLQDVILYRLIKQDATKQSVAVDEAAVQKRLDEFMAELRKGLQPGQTLEAALEEEGSSSSRLYMRIKTEMLLQQLVEKTFKAEDFVKVSTIIFKPTSERSEAVADANRKAQEAYDKLVAGASWNEVLASSTQDANALQSNGHIGWRPVNAFPAGVQAELATVKIGGLTKPAQTVNGMQIFRVENRGVNVKDQELVELKNAYGRGYLNKLRSEAKIERIK